MAHGVPYRLIDFGDGRKWEALGDYVLDRPSPAAQRAKPIQHVRPAVDARFDSVEKTWQFTTPWPRGLMIDCAGFLMPVSPTPFGHIGLFPEQFDNWAWLRRQLPSAQPQQALNLFAYTGASSIAMAVGGAQVVHVDAAKPNVQAAKRAAELSGTDTTIRFLVDDASKFVVRELRRGNRYQTIVLDPPAYGHGPRGKAWRLERDLYPLLSNCLQLLSPPPCRLLVTGHSESVNQQEVAAWLQGQAGRGIQLQHKPMRLQSSQQRWLDCGFLVRATWR